MLLSFNSDNARRFLFRQVCRFLEPCENKSLEFWNEEWFYIWTSRMKIFSSFLEVNNRFYSWNESINLSQQFSKLKRNVTILVRKLLFSERYLLIKWWSPDLVIMNCFSFIALKAHWNVGSRVSRLNTEVCATIDRLLQPVRAWPAVYICFSDYKRKTEGQKL